MLRLRDSTLTLTIENDLAEIGRIADLIDTFCAEHGAEDAAHAINLALDELLTNTISYGYDDAARHAIDITIVADPGRLTVTIRDDARAFDPTLAEDPDIDAALDDRPIGGLGIHLVRAMVDEMTYSRDGGHNQLILTKSASPESGE